MHDAGALFCNIGLLFSLKTETPPALPVQRRYPHHTQTACTRWPERAWLEIQWLPFWCEWMPLAFSVVRPSARPVLSTNLLSTIGPGSSTLKGEREKRAAGLVHRLTGHVHRLCRPYCLSAEMINRVRRERVCVDLFQPLSVSWYRLEKEPRVRDARLAILLALSPRHHVLRAHNTDSVFRCLISMRLRVLLF